VGGVGCVCGGESVCVGALPVSARSGVAAARVWGAGRGVVGAAARPSLLVRGGRLVTALRQIWSGTVQGCARTQTRAARAHLPTRADQPEPAPVGLLPGGPVEGSGIVEVLLKGTWGVLSSDGFDDAAARVLCKQLGYADGRNLVAVGGRKLDLESSFRRIEGQYGYYRGIGMWRASVRCTGAEAGLPSCTYNATMSGYVTPAAVQCLLEGRFSRSGCGGCGSAAGDSRGAGGRAAVSGAASTLLLAPAPLRRAALSGFVPLLPRGGAHMGCPLPWALLRPDAHAACCGPRRRLRGSRQAEAGRLWSTSAALGRPVVESRGRGVVQLCHRDGGLPGSGLPKGRVLSIVGGVGGAGGQLHRWRVAVA
jgi:hypothetical protein